jgi:hypothetical protein
MFEEEVPEEVAPKLLVPVWRRFIQKPLLPVKVIAPEEERISTLFRSYEYELDCVLGVVPVIEIEPPPVAWNVNLVAGLSVNASNEFE